MKRILTFLLAGIMMLTLAACKNSAPACVPVSASQRSSDSQNRSPAGILLGTGIDEFSCRYAWSCDDGNDSKKYQNAASIENQNMEPTNAYFVISNLWHSCFS